MHHQQQAACAIIIEVRRQFAEIPGLREGTADADSDKCVAISTQSSVEEMILPGLYAILSPITVGFLVGPRCLTGLLGGSIASGMMLAIMMANAGGAWDNSKKYIEIEGACGGKGTDTHKVSFIPRIARSLFRKASLRSQFPHVSRMIQLCCYTTRPVWWATRSAIRSRTPPARP
jgi:K(+)-stimulated pyrophosphate-energized sodium pump